MIYSIQSKLWWNKDMYWNFKDCSWRYMLESKEMFSTMKELPPWASNTQGYTVTSHTVEEANSIIDEVNIECHGVIAPKNRKF